MEFFNTIIENVSPSWLLIALLFLLFALILMRYKKSSFYPGNQNTTPVTEEAEIPSAPSNDYYPYHKKYLLTKHEYYFFKNLYAAIAPYNLSIIAKIRLADLVEVNANMGKKYMSYFGKIQSKHIDFALVIPEKMEINYLIELDDSSHEARRRVDRDNFVNNLLETIGYTLIRTYGDLSGLVNIIENDRTITKKEVKASTVPKPSVNEMDISNIVKEIYTKVDNIEKLINDVNDEPYIISDSEEVSVS